MTQDIPKGVVELVTPSEKESIYLEDVVGKVLAKARSVSTKFPEVRGLVLGGSFARGTWLPGEADIDIFVKFSPETDEKSFEEVGLKVGFEATKGYPRGKKFSQHPYTEALVDGVIINVVPCYDVEARKWKSAADRSPYHVELIRRSLNEAQKLDVRLLKKFLKGVGVYGAEIEKEGFSGYAAEVLILKDGTFQNVLTHFAHLRAPEPEKLLSLPDPVDESRDLARAISNENIARFVLAARAYLKRPSLEFFRGRRGKSRQALQANLIGLAFSHPELSEDILFGELKRTLRHLSRHIASSGFGLARTSIASDKRTKSAFLILPELRELPLLEKRAGPSVVMEKEAHEFVVENSRMAKLVWVGGDGRLYILQNRVETELTDFLLGITKGAVSRMGGSPEINRAIAKTGRILENRALLKAAKSQRWLSEGVREIVSDALGTGPD